MRTAHVSLGICFVDPVALWLYVPGHGHMGGDICSLGWLSFHQPQAPLNLWVSANSCSVRRDMSRLNVGLLNYYGADPSSLS
jgi:hypothetical protein